MIQQSKTETQIDGNISMVTNELALLTVVLLEKAAEETGQDYNDVKAYHEKVVWMNELTRKGMSIEDALDVAGLTDKIAKIEKHNLDGTIKEVKLEGQKND